MDKVKQILEKLQKHHFWILCGLAGFVGLVAWYLSASKLDAQFIEDSKKIDSTFTALNGITEEQAHDEWKTQADKRTEEAKHKVKEVWDQLYEQQKTKAF